MARIAALMEPLSADLRNSPDATNHLGRDTSPNGEVLMEQILDSMNTTPREEVLKRIAFLPHIRRDKVLNIRRQIMDGTYEVADRFGKTIDRVLEALTT